MEDVIEFLQENPYEEFSAGDIATKLLHEIHIEAYKEKNHDSLQSTINKYLRRSLKRGTYPELMGLETSKSPKTYYWKGDNPELNENFEAIIKLRQENTENIPQTKQPQTNKPVKMKRTNKQPEAELYEPLINFLEVTERIKTYIIVHQTTRSKRGSAGSGKGVHPDIVGVQGLRERREWDSRVREIANLIKPVQAKLWSFELKKGVTKNDVYMHYQQAVSNSSWANFGYLCVGYIDTKETEDKLHMFHTMHGIGVIRIDKNNNENTRILIKAKEREVDFNFCDTLANNGDFKKFLNKAIDTYKTGNAF